MPQDRRTPPEGPQNHTLVPEGVQGQSIAPEGLAKPTYGSVGSSAEEQGSPEGPHLLHFLLVEQRSSDARLELFT